MFIQTFLITLRYIHYQLVNKLKTKNMKKTMLAVFAAGLLFATPSCKKGENDPALSLKSRKGRLTAEWTVASFVETSTYTQTYVDDTGNPGDILSSTNTETMTFENGATSVTSTNSSTYDGQGGGGLTAASSESTASGSTITASNSSTLSSGTITSSSTGAYASSGEMKITFEKDGTFTMTRTMSSTVTYTDDTDAAFKEIDASTDSETSTITGTWSFLAKNKADEFKNKERIALWYKDANSTSTGANDVTYTDKDATDGYDYSQDSYTNSNSSTDGNVDSSSSPDEIWELDMLKSKEVTAVRTYSYTSTGTSSSSSTSGGTTTTATGNPSNNTGEGTTTMTLTRE